MSTEYLLPCTCGKETSVVPSQAGQNVTCACGLSLAVPKFRDFSKLEKAENPAARKLAGKRASDSWHAGFGGVGAILLGLSLIGLSVCGYFVWERSRIDTSVTIDDELRAGNRYYDSLRPSEVFLGAQEMIANGMGVRDNPPAWHIEQLWAEYYEERALYSGVTGLALLGLASLFFWLSRRFGVRKTAMA